MVCLSPSRIASLQERIAKKQAQLAQAEAAYERALDETESYKFDSGVGSQQLKSRRIDELSAQIDRLEAQIDSLERTLSGKSIFNLNLRRIPG